MIAVCRRFASLDRSRRLLVVDAVASMALAGAGLRLLRFLTLRRLLHRYARVTAVTDCRASQVDTIDAVRWAIAAVAARLPWATCLVQALAADAMLRRRGLDSELRLGVRVADRRDCPIEGHAWVDCGQGATIGVAESPSYEVLTAPSRR